MTGALRKSRNCKVSQTPPILCMAYSPGKRYQTFVGVAIRTLAPKMFLGHWRVNQHFVESIKDGTGQEFTAEMEADHVYFEADLHFSRMLEAKFDAGHYRYVLEDITHELAHIVTDPYYEHLKLAQEPARQLNERITQHIAMIIAGQVSEAELAAIIRQARSV